MKFKFNLSKKYVWKTISVYTKKKQSIIRFYPYAPFVKVDYFYANSSEEIQPPKFRYTNLDGSGHIGTFVEIDNGTLIYLDENGKESGMPLD